MVKNKIIRGVPVEICHTLANDWGHFKKQELLYGIEVFVNFAVYLCLF